MSSSPLSFKDQAYPLLACRSLGDRKTPLPVVSQVFAPPLPPQPSPPPLFPSLPFIPGTVVRASSFGPLRIPGQNQKPPLTPMTRPAVVLSGMWRPPGVGWGACMLPIYIPHASFKGSRGRGGGRPEGAGGPEPPDFKRGERGRGKNHGLRGLRPGVRGQPRGTEDSWSGQDLALHTPASPLIRHIVWIWDFTLYSIWLLLFFNEVRLKIHPPRLACLGLKAIKLETNLLISVSLCKSHLINSLSSWALTTARPREGIGLPRDL